uniref:Uncharacterized protein n=1 Tax=Rhizophora mucronata TaxID=61149 RepID=A0A2P2QPI4_RHIMU
MRASSVNTVQQNTHATNPNKQKHMNRVNSKSS